MGKPTFGQAQHVLTLIQGKDLSSERLTALYNSGLLSDLLDADPAKIDREAFRASLVGGARIRSATGKKKLLASTTPGTEPFLLTVEYAELEEMIASGNYDWKNDNITSSRFPVTGKGTVKYEARYFHFNRSISSEKAAKEMKDAGWAPAETPHLLAFGAKHPDEQGKFPIVALGSVADVGGPRFVPVLSRSDAGRRLSLSGWDGGWSAYYRFLAVRPVSVT